MSFIMWRVCGAFSLPDAFHNIRGKATKLKEKEIRLEVEGLLDAFR